MTGDDQFPFRDALREALLEAIEREQADATATASAGQPARHRHWYSRFSWAVRIPAIGAGVAILVVMVLIGVQVLSPGGSRSDADEVLGALERVALTTPVAPVAGGYVYSKVALDMEVTRASATGEVLYRATIPAYRERWIAADDTGRERTSPAGPPKFANPANQATWEASGSPPLLADQDVEIEAGDLAIGRLFPGQVLGLPTEPGALRRELQKLVESSTLAGGESLAYDMLQVVVSGLLWLNPPPELRAAMFAALGEQPGIEVQRGVVDGLGRSGVSLWVRNRGLRTELVVDPATAQVLGVNYIVEDRELSDRKESGHLTLVQTGVVEGITETP